MCGIILRMRSVQPGQSWVFVSFVRGSGSRRKYRLTTYKQCWRSCASKRELDYHIVLKLCFATLLVNLITDKKSYLNAISPPEATQSWLKSSVFSFSGRLPKL